jgi:hypothetical protein
VFPLYEKAQADIKEVQIELKTLQDAKEKNDSKMATALESAHADTVKKVAKEAQKLEAMQAQVPLLPAVVISMCLKCTSKSLVRRS